MSLAISLPNATLQKLQRNQRQDPDFDLVIRCRNGERQAQYELYEKYRERMFTLAYRMANQQTEAEDLTQQIFVRLFRKIDRFRGDSAFSSWLYRLATNVCLNHFRKEKRRREVFTPEIESERHSDSSGTADGKIDFKPLLQKAIRALPEGYRLVFVLYHVEGFSHKEIAEMLGTSEGTSKSQLHKARRELRRMLQPYLALQKSLNRVS